LLGAFIVRSGVLTSVHAFAVDPERGLFILTLLGLVVGGSLFLYALRAPVIRSRIQYDGISRELLLLVNNLILVIAMAVVFLGTLYPLAYEALNDGAKISVGPPYFNRLFVPLMMVLAFFLALAPVARWKRTPLALFRNSAKLLGVSIVVGVAAPLVFGGVLKPGSVVAGALGFWIVASHGVDVWRRYPSLPGSYVGMTIAHLGFAVSMIGIAVTSEFSVERDVRLSIGETIEVNGTQYRFTGMIRVQGPNYVADQGQFVLGDGTLLKPEKRRYSSPGGSGGDIMTEAAIDAGLFRDRYVALGEPLQDGSWGVRIHDKPLVRWTWLGGLLMCLGGIVAVTDARYRRLKVRAGALAAAGAVS
jgi:cytochrome c-type biogenesis protein CcmF